MLKDVFFLVFTLEHMNVGRKLTTHNARTTSHTHSYFSHIVSQPRARLQTSGPTIIRQKHN